MRISLGRCTTFIECEEYLLNRSAGAVRLLCLLTIVTPVWAQDSNPVEPTFAYRIDEVGRAVGLRPLRAGSGLPAGHRELRVWIGFGLFVPQTFTRIQADGRSVTGSRVFWWTTAADSAEEAAADQDSTLISNAELYANLRQTVGCGPVRRHGEYEMCTASLTSGETWPHILASLDTLGIGTLPDAATLSPRAGIGLDGWSIVVEVREGRRYRTYSYCVPQADAAQPEVRRAAAIAETLGLIGYRK